MTDTAWCPRGTWGGFRVGTMALALPLTAIHEARPLQRLQTLPVKLPGLAGALPWRSALVPVADLRLLLHATAAEDAEPGTPPPADATTACLLLVQHDRRVLGLRVDAVEGVYALMETTARQVHVDGGPCAGLLAGSAQRADTGKLVSLLDPAALFDWPGLPTLDDPLAAAAQDPVGLEHAGTAGMERPMLFMRCGAQGLAIDALAVHATLANPAVQPSVLSDKCCAGVVEHAGMLLPAVDLAALCGLPQTGTPEHHHAVLLQRPEGRVALLVDEVRDIGSVPAAKVMPIPPHALPAGSLVQAVLDHEGRQYLVIDDGGLHRHPAVCSWAAVNTPAGRAGRPRDGTPPAALPGRQDTTQDQAQPAGLLIGLGLDPELAVRVEDVREIIPTPADEASFGPQAALRGYVVLRGKSLALLCLSRLLGLAPPPADQLRDSCALVVEPRAGVRLALRVPRLTALEPARQEPQCPRPVAAQLPAGLLHRHLAVMGQGAATRTVPVLNLLTLTASLEARQAQPG